MASQITTVSTKGQFVIPAEMRSALGIKPGTRIAVTHERGKIILQPVTAELVEKTRGILKGGPSLTKSLLRERRHAKDRW